MEMELVSIYLRCIELNWTLTGVPSYITNDGCLCSRRPPLLAPLVGCISYDCFQESLTPENFLFVEVWANDEAAKLHVKTKHMDEVHKKINNKLRRKPRMVKIGNKL